MASHPRGGEIGQRGDYQDTFGSRGGYRREYGLRRGTFDLLRDAPQLSTPVAVVSLLAVTTSLVGVILGFVNEFYDAIGALPSQSYGPKDDNKWQVALLTLVPSAFFSILLGYYVPDMDRYQVMEYTGAFGASTLFLILPALMVWQNRYGDDARPLTVKPMFPLGKITLGSLYKAAGTLIVEQGLEKLGVFEFVQEHLLKSGDL
jgi:tyrosine-specific transport protein